MREIYRKSIPIDACTTISSASRKFGGTVQLLNNHKIRHPENFPKPVARFGTTTLYVENELEAYYKTVLWRYADAAINKMYGGLDNV